MSYSTTDADRPLVTRARRPARDLLAPQAARVDQEGIPPGHLDAIKESGLPGVNAPAAYGGWAAPRRGGPANGGDPGGRVPLGVVRADPAPHARRDAGRGRRGRTGAAAGSAGARRAAAGCGVRAGAGVSAHSGAGHA
ncbi:acyl-CoA dehydrogenase family protein [Streptomyces zinciresistens]|uniref:acyl-CoA dehydrogenase family protein n=1 Tax=Streptomyces zinciresistens TaxID=1073330 RepID=UPI003CC55743